MGARAGLGAGAALGAGAGAALGRRGAGTATDGVVGVGFTWTRAGVGLEGAGAGAGSDGAEAGVGPEGAGAGAGVLTTDVGLAGGVAGSAFVTGVGSTFTVVPVTGTETWTAGTERACAAGANESNPIARKTPVRAVRLRRDPALSNLLRSTKLPYPQE
jgi:hypothetical protein